ncbi:TolC family protein [Comamonas testosteroni]|uniref:TolC family protein n=1 Tax=Comamonas testosteroni TaxID=285 RepID=UPI00265F4CD2|nr:TolC family protein [Comamonas testosteroni]WKL16819.1 TolC family protein [Comamonas testosteroni]
MRSPKRAAVFGLCLAAALVANAQTNAYGTQQVSSTISDLVQPKLTLTQLVQTVLDNNPELRSVQQSSVTAQAAVVSAGALPNPKLEWSRGDNKARLASATPGNVQTMGISVPIEMPSVRAARVEAAQAGQRASVHQIAASRNALVAQVKLKAYEVVLRQAQAQAAYDAVKLLEQAHERVRVRVSSGEAARYEIIKADAELINARQQEQSARLLAEQSQLTLNRLAAGQLPNRFDLALSLQDPVEKAQLQNINWQSHPELLQLQSDVDKAEAQKNGAKASRWPGLELRYAQTREPDIRNNTIGVSMQIPLFDQRRGPIDEAASEAERARLRMEGRKAELEQQMLQAWKVMEMAQVRTKALSEGAVREAESALRVAEAAYRFGERGILDVLDAQRVLRTVRADLLEARYQLQSARIELDFLAGRYAQPSSL